MDSEGWEGRPGVLLGYFYGQSKRTALGSGSLLVGLYDPEQDQFVTVTKIAKQRAMA